MAEQLFCWSQCFLSWHSLQYNIRLQIKFLAWFQEYQHEEVCLPFLSNPETEALSLKSMSGKQ